MNLVPWNKKLRGQTSHTLKIGLICLDNQTRIPSKQLSGVLPSRSEPTNVFVQDHLHSISSFFVFSSRPKSKAIDHKSYVYIWYFLVSELTFSRATRCISSSRRCFSINLKLETSCFIAVSTNIFSREFHMHVTLLEIPTHLSPELPTRRLPPRSQWNFIFV